MIHLPTINTPLTCRYKCEDEESAMWNIRTDIRTMYSTSENSLRVFGPWAPQLLHEMEKNCSIQVQHMPKGPLGEIVGYCI